jgi:hypothetical protein
VLNRRLQVMDSTAITFCMDNRLPIIVFDVMEPGNINRALLGEPIGTLVSTACQRCRGGGPLMHDKVGGRRQDAQGRA